MDLVAKNLNVVADRKESFGDHLSDQIAAGMGSWRFIIIQSLFVAIWITVNIFALALRWDPYPFILLNLLFSTQAAYAAPVIMMSQNRQASKDRLEAELDYQTNKKAELEIIDMQKDLANLATKVNTIIDLLTKSK